MQAAYSVAPGRWERRLDGARLYQADFRVQSPRVESATAVPVKRAVGRRRASIDRRADDATIALS
jgi:hypothetical protein